MLYAAICITMKLDIGRTDKKAVCRFFCFGISVLGIFNVQRRILRKIHKVSRPFSLVGERTAVFSG